jgi:uncharacterized protein YbaP (TraB family)
MLRRYFTLSACAWALAPVAFGDTAPTRGPLFWAMRQGKARVYLLGFADARDRSWFTPPIRRAFEQSSTLWTEIGRPSSKEAADEILRTQGHDEKRTFFDVLEPSVRKRATAYMSELEIQESAIATMRPWRAFYTFAGAFAQKHKSASVPEETPDRVLLDLAVAAGKKLEFELPGVEWLHVLAGMSDKAQSQYMEWLFDYLDEDKLGRNEPVFGWTTANPAPNLRSLERMRTKTPELYEVMQKKRNESWARLITRMLEGEGTHFAAVGMLHVLGPDGIPQKLQQRGITLAENPPVS